LADQIIAEVGLGLMDNREALHHQRERAQEEALGHEAERQEIEEGYYLFMEAMVTV
jgi:hypothetical protein